MIGDVEEGREVVASMTTTLVGETRSFRSFRFDTGNTGYLKKKERERREVAGGVYGPNGGIPSNVQIS